jgi:Type IV secretion system pilin
MKYLTLILFFFTPWVSLAQELTYTPLVGIPGVATGAAFTFDTFINSIYALSITIAALLAVIKIIIAGVKWMLTDVVTSKEEAKKDIKGALFGLLIVLSAVLIISVINKDILEVDLGITRAPNLQEDNSNLNLGGNGSGGGSNTATVPGTVVSNTGNQQGSGVPAATCVSLTGTVVGSVCTNMRGAGGSGMTAEVCENAFGGNFAPGSGSCENVRIVQ